MSLKRWLVSCADMRAESAHDQPGSIKPDGYCVRDARGFVVWPSDGALETLANATLAAALVPGAKVEPVIVVSSANIRIGKPRSFGTAKPSQFSET